MIDFNERLARKEGRVTPKALLENALNRLGEIDQIIYVVKDHDGTVKVGYSEGGLLQALGMLEAAKVDVINDMYE
ncbi:MULTISPECIES: hypothetical protein [Rummeliibacillus]|uniref:hypothetical protein n=1 Tax=Rummeliibacillus TaxID=648802 RepID=UPI00123AB85C|nr:hypothetical protein [Rummeliibacillus sp. TYF-LIM-RU47]